jgi:hypothetical protein
MKPNTTLEQILDHSHTAVQLDLKMSIAHSGLAQRVLATACVLVSADAINAARLAGREEAPNLQVATLRLTAGIVTMKCNSEYGGPVQVVWTTMVAYHDFSPYMIDAALVHMTAIENVIQADPTEQLLSENRVRSLPPNFPTA